MAHIPIKMNKNNGKAYGASLCARDEIIEAIERVRKAHGEAYDKASIEEQKRLVVEEMGKNTKG